MTCPWYRAISFWLAVIVGVAIAGSWIHSRYYCTEISSGGDAGVWVFNDRSAIGVGFSLGPSSYPNRRVFRINDRDPEFFCWNRLLEFGHDKGRNGYALYLPHYMLLIGWALAFGLMMFKRLLRHRRIRRGLEALTHVDSDKSSQTQIPQ